MKNSEGCLLDQIELENGLTVFLYDRSKPIAGGRCQVRLLAMVPVPLKGTSMEIDEKFIQEQGESLVFNVEKTRNFIAREEVPAVLERMKDDFLASNRGYLSHRDFAEKFCLKSYTEWKRNRELKNTYAMALESHSARQES